MGSVIGDIMNQGGSSELSALQLLNSTKDFQQLKMLSELSPGLVYTFAVAGMLQKRYKNPILKQFIEEFLSFQKSRDRQGITEFVEVLLGLRRMGEGGDLGE